MTDLIKIESKGGVSVQTVNARDLWQTLESKQDFSTWVKSRLDGFEEGRDYLLHKFVEQVPSGAKHKIDYQLLVETAKHIAMMERNEKGRELRQYFIKVEEAWNDPALVMARAVQTAQVLLTIEREKVAQLEPKAEAFEILMKTETDMSITNAAKHFGAHPKTEVFPYLRDHGFLTKEDLPTQYAIDMDVLWLKESKSTIANKTFKQAVVKASQLDRFRKLIIEKIKRSA